MSQSWSLLTKNWTERSRAFPEEDLATAVALVGAHCDDAVAPWRPVFALEADLGRLSRGLAVGIDVQCVPALGLHGCAEQVGRLLRLDDDEGAAVMDGIEQGTAVASCVDADGDHGIASDGLASSIAPLLKVFEVGLAERGVA